MKRLYLFLVIILCGFNLGCSKDDDDSNTDKEEALVSEEQKEDVRYYVKYEVAVTYGYQATIKFTYNTAEGEKTTTIENSELKNGIWEGTYGPVPKSFKAKLSCPPINVVHSYTIIGRIYISREKEPFVIKAEDTMKNGNKTISLLCNIDF